MGATRLASGFFFSSLVQREKMQLLFSGFRIFLHFLYPDARRVALSLQQLSGAAANL